MRSESPTARFARRCLGAAREIAADLADRSDPAQRRRLVAAANSAIGAGPR